MSLFVLDSYALLAYFQDEPGAKEVERILRMAEDGQANLFMCVVNWAEVYYNTARTKGFETAEEALLVMEQLGIELVGADKQLMYTAAKLKARYPIALGDCAAAALALLKECPVVTGDPEFKRLGDDVKVHWLTKMK